MPQQRTIEKARKDARAGKSPSTQAGEFVKEEIDEIRAGKHGVRNAKQAIAIGLSKARKAGVNLPPPPDAKEKTAKKKVARKSSSETSARRSAATLKALKKEPTSTVSPENLAKQARSVAKKRGPKKRHEAAMKASRTKRRMSTSHRAHS